VETLIHKLKYKNQPEIGVFQAGEFAKGLSLGLNIPLQMDVFLREVFSVSQTQKSRTERYDNVKNVFGLKSEETLQGWHILLVDDVLTTAATICEVASLLSANSAIVSIVTIVRA
jgi:predicted amidophosphoribosyltransferase